MNKSTIVTITLSVIIVGGILLLGGGDATQPNTNSMDTQNDQTAGDVAPDEGVAADTTTPTDLDIVVLAEGEGEEIVNGNTAVVHYTGTLTDGTVFDSSVDRGPFSFALGAGQVIAGWDQGVLGMKPGEKRKLTIPSHLAYGPGGVPGVIPANATLVFEVELLEIQ